MTSTKYTVHWLVSGRGITASPFPFYTVCAPKRNTSREISFSIRERFIYSSPHDSPVRMSCHS